MSLRSAIRRIPLCHAIGRAWNRRVWLQRARQRQTYSQNGEDCALLELFPADFKGIYVDLGANHPYFISNTHLLYTRGWHGLCVDALPMFAPLYRRHRPRDVFLNKGVSMTAGAFDFYEMDVPELSTFSRELADDLVASRRAALTAVHRIEAAPVSEIISDFAPSGNCDVLSIDVEGLDAEIVRSTDWGFVNPRVVICETSSFEHDWTNEIIGLFAARGFRHYRHVGCNDIFVNTAPGRDPAAA
ncbi:MAG: FkbM family methyltransferase [Planctomycetes bacterium]|nr:FkbM family methyltransferase [Planctomycetota bacterium]